MDDRVENSSDYNALIINDDEPSDFEDNDDNHNSTSNNGEHRY